MKTFGIQLQEGSSISNMTVASGTSFPGSPNDGELFYRTDSDLTIVGMYAYINGNWDRISSSDAMTAPKGATFPTNSVAGDIFYKDSNDAYEGLYVYSGSAWVSLTGSGGAASYTITGDVSGTIDGGTDALTLASVGTAGTYTSVTTDAKGRVTAGTNPGFLTANQTITLSGDVSGSGTTAITTALPTVNINVGSFGTATKVGQFTVDGKGRITAASEVSISFPSTVITDFTEATQDVVGALIGGANGVTSTYNDVANTLTIGLSGVPNSALQYDTVTIGSTSIALGDTVTAIAGLSSVTSTTFIGNLSGHLTTARNFSASGDASASAVSFDGSANVDLVLTLATVGTAGTYGSASSIPVLTVDAKGRVTGVTDTTISIAESQILDGTILARVGANETITGSWAFSNPVVGAAPTTASHFTTKQYVDNALAGLTWKHPVRVSTSSNIALTGTQTIDGVAVVDGDRVLVKNQTAGADNGVYIVNGTGVWSRSTDFDETAPIDEVNSAAVFVSEGTSLHDTGWTQINTVVTVGTDTMAFVQFSGAGAYTAGTGMTLVGNDFRVNTASTARIVVGADDIDLATVGTPVTDSLVKITTDNWGRVSATSAISTADLSALLDATYVNVVGDTMTGNLAITETTNTTSSVTVTNSSTGTGASARLLTGNGTDTAGLILYGTGHANVNNTTLFTTGSGNLTFQTGATEKARINNSGQLLVGATSAFASEQIFAAKSAPATTTGFIAMLNTGTTTGSGTAINFGTNTNSGAAVALGSIAVQATDALGAGDMIFTTRSTTASERARIKGAGNILIGGFSSARTLVNPAVQPLVQVEGLNSSTALSVIRNSNDAGQPLLILGKTRGAAIGAVTPAVQANDVLGELIFAGADGTGLITGASISSFIDGTVATNGMPGRLVFNTTAAGAASPTARMTIDSSGNVGIGATPTGTYALDIQRSDATVYVAASSTLALPAGGALVAIDNQNQTDGNWSGLVLAAKNTLGVSNISYIGNVSGNGVSGGTMVFGHRTNSLAYAETMRIDTSGNLGVGTTSIATGVKVQATVAGTAGASVIRVSNDTDTGWGQMQYVGSTFATTARQNTLELVTGTSTSPLAVLIGGIDKFRVENTQTIVKQPNGTLTSFVIQGDSSTANAKVGAITLNRFNYDPTGTTAEIAFYRGGGATDGFMAFATSNSGTTGNPATERMRLDSTGKLGIGSSSTNLPVATLDVSSANQAATLTTGTTNILVRTTDALGTDVGGSIGFAGFTTSTVQRNFGVIAGRKENATDGDSSGYLSFSTNLSATGLAERMRITSGGLVGIGKTPTQLIDAVRNGNASTVMSLSNNDAGVSVDARYNATNGTDTFSLIMRGTGNSLGVQGVLSVTGTNPMAFYTGGSERARIDAVGLGVGAAAATRPIELTHATRALIRTNASATTGVDAVSGLEMFAYDGAAVTTGATVALNYSLQGTDPNALIVSSSRAGSAIVFKTGGTERMRLDATGMTIAGAKTTTGDATFGGNIILTRGSSTTISRNATSGYVALSGGASAIDGPNIILGGSTAASFANQMMFRNNTANLGMFDSSGRFIVTAATTPTAQPIQALGSANTLLVQTSSIASPATAASGFLATRYGGTTANNAPAIATARSRGVSDGSQVAVVSGDALGYLMFTGSDGTLFQEAARITPRVDGTVSSTAMPGRLEFLTTPAGSVTPVLNMVLTAAGNLGIGVAANAPVNKLTVQSASTAGVAVVMNLNNPRAFGTGLGVAGSALRFNHTPTDAGSTGVLADIYGVSEDETTSTTGSLAFATRSGASEVTTEKMRINSGGLITMGSAAGVVTTPRVVEVAGGGTAGTTNVLNIETQTASQYPGITIVRNDDVSATLGAEITLARTRGAVVGSVLAAVTGDVLGGIAFAGADGTDIRTKAAEIVGYAEGTVGSSIMPGRLTFGTTAAGAGVPTERMRISSTGNVGIGATGTTLSKVTISLNTSTLLPTIASMTGINLLLIGDGTSVGNRIFLDNYTVGGGAQNWINARVSGGTITAPAATVANDVMFGISTGGYGATSYVNAGLSRMMMMAEATFTDTSMPTYITFQTTPVNGTSGAERLRIDSAGNVGINVTNPASYGQLVVRGPRTTSSGEFLGGLTVLDSTTGGTAGVGGVLTFGGDTQGAGYKQFASVLGGKENSTVTDVAGYLAFYSRPAGGNLTERVRIDSTGQVGIGTSTPSSALDVRAGATAIVSIGRTANAGVGSQPSIIDAVGPNASGTAKIWTRLMTVVDDATNATEDADLSVMTIGNGVLAERIRFDSTGNIGVNGAAGAWAAADKVIDFTYPAVGMNSTGQAFLGFNLREGSAGVWTYKSSDFGALFASVAGGWAWSTAPSGTVSTTATVTERMRIDNTGKVGINRSTFTTQLEVGGSIATVTAAGTDTSIAANINAVSNLAIGCNDTASTNVFGAPAATNYLGCSIGRPTVFTTGATERMRITTGGDVGIGQNNPSARLHVTGGTIRHDGGNILGAGGNANFLAMYGGSDYNLGAGVVTYGASHATLPNVIQFSRGAFVESARFDASGNFGVGATTLNSGARLTVTSASIGGQIVALNSPSLPTAAVQRLGGIGFGVDGETLAGSGARIECVSDAAWTSNTSTGASLLLKTTAIGSTTPTTRLTIDSTGLATFTGNVIGATPTIGTHLTTKTYVDNAILGLSWKAPVRVATTANITLSAPQTIDGVAAIAGDRVLVKNQTTASQNGVYVVAAAAWVRATDFDAVSPIDEVNGAAMMVKEGTANADTCWTQTGLVATVGTDAMAFVQFMNVVALQAGAGLVVSGNGIGVATANAANIVVNADSIDLATVSQATSGSFVKVTLDGYGRVTGNTAVTLADINTLTAPGTLTVGQEIIGSAGAVTGYASGLMVNYSGGGTMYGITMKPLAANIATTTQAIAFVTYASSNTTPVLLGSIQHLANDVGLNLAGSWSMNGSALQTTASVTTTLGSYMPKVGGTFTGPITVDSNAQLDTITTAATTTTATTIASFLTATYRTAKFLVQVTDTTNSQYHAVEITLIHNGTTVFKTEYGEVSTNGALGTFDASITTGTLSLQFTATAATTKSVKVYMTTLTV